jgi:hypothetical protein
MLPDQFLVAIVPKGLHERIELGFRTLALSPR